MDVYPRRATMVGVKYASELRTMVLVNLQRLALTSVSGVTVWTYICEVVSDHARSEACLKNFSLACTLSGEATCLCLKLSCNTTLLIITEPFRHSWPVWQEHYN